MEVIQKVIIVNIWLSYMGIESVEEEDVLNGKLVFGVSVLCFVVEVYSRGMWVVRLEYIKQLERLSVICILDWSWNVIVKVYGVFFIFGGQRNGKNVLKFVVKVLGIVRWCVWMIVKMRCMVYVVM